MCPHEGILAFGAAADLNPHVGERVFRPILVETHAAGRREQPAT